MKAMKIMISALFCFFIGTTSAQNDVTVTLPDWGVADANDARYYYIPDIETYYDVRSREFVHMDNGKWVRNAELPATYSDYDLYDGYKVVLNEDREPFVDFDKHRVQYTKGYKGDKQKTVKVKKNKVKIKEK